jgi:hypothetical protein
MGPQGRRLVRLVALACLVPSGTLGAQGVTTAGIGGIVSGSDSVPLDNATITVTNTANGERWQTVTRGRGLRRRFGFRRSGQMPFVYQAVAARAAPAAAEMGR